MRVKNKGGVTPRDRRLDRGKVATVAALAAVLLFATQARAGEVNFVVNSAQSQLGLKLEVYDSGDPNTRLLIDNISPQSNYGNPDPSNVANAFGWLRADWTQGASLQLLANESQISYFNSFPYFPYKFANGSIANPPNGIPHLSQLGFEIYLSTDGGANYDYGFGFANIYNLFQRPGSPSTGAVDGGSAMPYVGNDGNDVPGGGTEYYTALDNGMMAVSGLQDLFGALTDEFDLSTSGVGDTPFPSPLGGAFDPFSAQVMTFDGTTLTIDMNFHLDFVDDTTVYAIDTFGQIVANVNVPEPSSMLMLGCGVIGLVGCFVRTRKRRG